MNAILHINSLYKVELNALAAWHFGAVLNKAVTNYFQAHRSILRHACKWGIHGNYLVGYKCLPRPGHQFFQISMRVAAVTFTLTPKGNQTLTVKVCERLRTCQPNNNNQNKQVYLLYKSSQEEKWIKSPVSANGLQKCQHWLKNCSLRPD